MTSVDAFNDVLRRLMGVKSCSFASVLHDNPNGGYTRDDESSGASPLKGSCDLGAVDFRLSEDELDGQLKAWESLWEGAWSTAGREPLMEIPMSFVWS